MIDFIIILFMVIFDLFLMLCAILCVYKNRKNVIYYNEFKSNLN